MSQSNPTIEIPRAVINRLLSAGFAAYYVGGCVRDRLRGLVCSDIDIATNATLEEIKRVFPRASVVGEAFSVALVDGFEVATFRQDGPYSDFRHPDYVKFVATIEEDLSRRDFTINAMAEDSAGRIIDPFGGRRDLEDRTIRFVGDPASRLNEDPIRAMRACRFAALIGGTLEADTAKAIREAHALLDKPPRERLQLELNKILMLDDRETALFLVADLQLLPHVLPMMSTSVGVPQEGYHAEDCWVHAVKTAQAIRKKDLNLRLAALLHDIAKPAARTRDDDGVDHFYGHEIDGVSMAEEELRNLRYGARAIAYVEEAVRFHMNRLMFVREMKDATIRRLMSRLERLPVRDLLRLQLADMQANLREPYTSLEQRGFLKYALSRIRAIEAQEHALKITDLAIGGRDVIKALNVQPGPVVGKALRFCFDRVLQEPELNTREALLELLDEFGDANAHVP